MGRNDNRLGIPEQTDEIPTGVATNMPPVDNAPQFNWTVPTEMVSLPSQGRYYPEGHPLCGETTVEIRYMTAKDEDILTSRALLKEGIAIDRLLQNILVNKEINVNSLLIGDKNALIVASRITGYGTEYSTNVTCPSCNTVGEYAFDLDAEDGATDVESALEKYEATASATHTFTVELPLTRAAVECRLLTGIDELKLAKEAQRQSKKKQGETTLTSQLGAFIVSVNGESDHLTKVAFIQNLPARDSRYLRTFYSDITPNLDMNQTYECASCGYTADMEVPLTADFFWPKR